MDWERVLKRYEELEEANHSTYAMFELAIIFGEYDLSEFLEGAMELNKRQGYFTGQQSQDIYEQCKPYKLYQRLWDNVENHRAAKRIWKGLEAEGAEA